MKQRIKPTQKFSPKALMSLWKKFIPLKSASPKSIRLLTSSDYQDTLLQASKSMIRVKDPLTLLRLITRMVDRKIGVTHVGLLLHDPKKPSYVLMDSKGQKGKKIPKGFIRLDESSYLIQHFLTPQKEKGALVVEEPQNTLDPIQYEMDLLQAKVCVPSYYKKDLVALMLLGQKLSKEPYQDHEVKLFMTLANDVAMAVTNAKLIKSLKEAYEKEHRLLIDTSSALVRAIDARDRYTRGHSENTVPGTPLAGYVDSWMVH